MTLSRSPRILKAGIALIDPRTSALVRVIVLQYNPDTLTRSFQIQGLPDGTDRSEALRLKGPPVETYKLDAEIDATDQLEHPREHAAVVQMGLQPALAALETLVYPASDQLIANNNLARLGTLEIIPMESPLALFIWSRSRVVPVRLTELSVTEDAFDADLNPIRAKVSLGMRVLSVNDLGFEHRGGAVYLLYQQRKERLAALARTALAPLGVTEIP